jgi:Fe2+ or Zn2+ uptake regulation protein
MERTLTSIDEMLEQLKARGERLTIQRRAVIDILIHAPDHLTIQEIQMQMKQTGLILSETTIYRILEWLKEQHLARRISAQAKLFTHFWKHHRIII